MNNENEYVKAVRRDLRWLRRITWLFCIINAAIFISCIINIYPEDPSLAITDAFLLVMIWLYGLTTYRAYWWERMSDLLRYELAACAVKGLIVAKMATRYELTIAELRKAETIDQVREIIKALNEKPETKDPPPEK